MTIRDALGISINQSSEYQIARYDFEIAKMSYDAGLRRMYFPNFSFMMNLTDTATVHKFPDKHIEPTSTTPDSYLSSDTNPTTNRGPFSGRIGFGFSEYVIFNSWIDSIDAKLNEFSFEAKKVAFNSKKRDLRFQIITNYYSLYQALKKEEIAFKDLQFAQAVLRLLKIQKADAKDGESEIQMAELDVTKAEGRLSDAKTNTIPIKTTFLQSLGISEDKDLKLTSEPQYFDLGGEVAEYERLFELYNENYLQSKMDLSASMLDEEKSRREEFPVKVSLSAITWLQNVGYYESNSGYSTGSSPDGNLNVSLGINVEIPIWNEHGFFNRNKRVEKILRKKTIEERLKVAKMNGILKVRSQYLQLQKQKQDIYTSKNTLLKSSELLTLKMKELLNNPAARLEMKTLLTETKEVELEYYEKVVNYIDLVISFSQTIGQDLTERVIQ
jgi:outer membrane protein TolC